VKKRLSVVGGEHATDDVLPEMPAGFGDAGLPRLTDPQGRAYSYLRLSVTDRCDFACVYCMPPGGEEDHAVRPELLAFEEAARLVSIFARMGVERVRFTGGEPLVRRDVVRLVRLVREQSGVSQLVMTTNASRLAALAAALREAGLTGVNVSLDSLDPSRFTEITRGGDLSRVIAGIEAAQDAGLSVKLNVVALGALNLGEAGRIVDWAWERGITPRFIELMPLGEAANLPETCFAPRSTLVRALGERVDEGPGLRNDGHGPARYLDARDGSGRRVGFITAVSDEFCASCNRVRVTARGEIRACLASRTAISLRDLLRAGAGDERIAWGIHQALGTKLRGHFFTDDGVDEHRRVGMSLIGG